MDTYVRAGPRAKPQGREAAVLKALPAASHTLQGAGFGEHMLGNDPCVTQSHGCRPGGESPQAAPWVQAVAAVCYKHESAQAWGAAGVTEGSRGSQGWGVAEL